MHVHDEIVLTIRLDVVILNLEQEIELALEVTIKVCQELRMADRRTTGASPPAGCNRPDAAAAAPVAFVFRRGRGQAVVFHKSRQTVSGLVRTAQVFGKNTLMMA